MDWDLDQRPEIWDMYEQEGAKPQDIIQAFRKEIAMDPEDLSPNTWPRTSKVACLTMTTP
jgi:hypothetical protein